MPPDLSHGFSRSPNLRIADLLRGPPHADLFNADLSGAYLVDADLSGARHLLAGFSGANLYGFYWPSDALMPPGWVLSDSGRLDQGPE